jgi:SAM-dependent methyltransferase
MATPTPASDRVFAGSIPRIYEAYMVPMVFAPYARDLAQRLRTIRATRVLEIAAGTGVVTRSLAEALAPAVSIVASDLNPAMLEQAAAIGTARPVQWQQADAMALPFGDASFDVVVCQFGVMFFPDRARGYAEARRVLAPGGTLVFNAWDRLEDNEFAAYVVAAGESIFPDDPPRFLARVPHGYCDTATIRDDLAAAGFGNRADIESVELRSLAESPRFAALGFCHGTPMRNEIEARDASRLGDVVDAATQTIARRFGTEAVDGRMLANVVTIRR